MVNHLLDSNMLSQPEIADRDVALSELRSFIAAGKYEPGDRLPPERELTANLGLTRTRLRRALESLEREGLIWRHVGKGTFVSAGCRDSLPELGRRVSPVQMMGARLALEPALAREAAINASGEAVARIGLSRDRAVKASSWREYETCDDMFHRAVAEATNNLLLLSLFDHLNRVRRTVAWKSVVRASPQPPDDHSSFAEHDRIFTAIDARDPAAARAAMRDHLGSVSARLFGKM